MSPLRALLAGAVSAATSFALVSASGCGTDAQGVEDCRRIEQARCAAAEPCGIIRDVEACDRFYRDQCLHGLSATPPGQPVIDDCVEVIRAAGECAESGPDTALADCSPAVTPANDELATACDVVLAPEYSPECAFLLAAPPSEEPDEPSDGGSGGQSAEPGGSGGGG